MILKEEVEVLGAVLQEEETDLEEVQHHLTLTN
jgi:hypothetical protein